MFNKLKHYYNKKTVSLTVFIFSYFTTPIICALIPSIQLLLLTKTLSAFFNYF